MKERYLHDSLLERVKSKFPNRSELIQDSSVNQEGPHIFQIYHRNDNGACFMFWKDMFYLSSNLPGDYEVELTLKYDERYSNFDLFLLRLTQILELGKSTQSNFSLDMLS